MDLTNKKRQTVRGTKIMIKKWLQEYYCWKCGSPKVMASTQTNDFSNAKLGSCYKCGGINFTKCGKVEVVRG
jgi:predicted RNA-binding Zn-ribbon protein involved in translation (DUF1610 family)